VYAGVVSAANNKYNDGVAIEVVSCFEGHVRNATSKRRAAMGRA